MIAVRSYCTVSSDKREKKPTKMSKKVAFKRLPANIVPKHYVLELKPDLQKFTFAGKTSVKIQVSFFFYKIKYFSNHVFLYPNYSKPSFKIICFLIRLNILI